MKKNFFEFFREYVESLHQSNHQSLLYGISIEKLDKINIQIFHSGKNNVSVFHSEWPQPQLGYLSLHQVRTFKFKFEEIEVTVYDGTCSYVIIESMSTTFPRGSRVIKLKLSFLFTQMGSTVLLKWTPNGLMDASGPAPFHSSDSNVDKSKSNFANHGSRKISPVSWQQAISINIATVLYIHCHQVNKKQIFESIFSLYLQVITRLGKQQCPVIKNVIHY